MHTSSRRFLKYSFLGFLVLSLGCLGTTSFAQGRAGVATPRGPGFGGAPVGPGFGGTARGPGFQGTPNGVGFDGRARGPGFSPGPNPIGFQGVPDNFQEGDNLRPVRDPRFEPGY